MIRCPLACAVTHACNLAFGRQGRRITNTGYKWGSMVRPCLCTACMWYTAYIQAKCLYT